jgi:hypothetical protein
MAFKVKHPIPSSSSQNLMVAFNLSSPDSYGTQTCVQLTAQATTGNLVKEVSVDFHSSHAKSEYVCVYGIAIVTESEMKDGSL